MLQDADIVFHDKLVDARVLDLPAQHLAADRVPAAVDERVAGGLAADSQDSRARR